MKMSAPARRYGVVAAPTPALTPTSAGETAMVTMKPWPRVEVAGAAGKGVFLPLT